VRPDTDRVFVVVGASSFEEFWIGQLTREFEPFKGRLTFEWSNGMSLEETLARSSSLPPHTAIFYVTLLVDAKGAVQTDERVLAQLHAAANAPYDWRELRRWGISEARLPPRSIVKFRPPTTSGGQCQARAL
jgi:hypothetical protein